LLPAAAIAAIVVLARTRVLVVRLMTGAITRVTTLTSGLVVKLVIVVGPQVPHSGQDDDDYQGHDSCQND
jgi:hypothetical protein